MSDEADQGRRGDEGVVGGVGSGDLAVVLSHYDLGVIESVSPLERGSRGRPKFVVRSQRGVFVVKRRVERREDLDRVAYTHAVQEALVKRGYPAPPVVRTRRHRGTVVIHGERLYELLGYLHGNRFDGSVVQSGSAGEALAGLHEGLGEFAWSGASPRVSLVDRFEHVRSQLAAIAARGGEAGGAAKELLAAHGQAVGLLSRMGADSWARCVVHGDWHPGNVLFSGGSVSGVTDFDTAREGARVMDVANGLLQFSITREEGHPRTWPDHIDEARFRSFARGYDGGSGSGLSDAEREATPWLMIEAMIGESVGPIATTGRFAAIEGGAFLGMVVRKVAWIEANAERLGHELSGGERG